MVEKLKQRWGVQTTREVVIILLVFSLTGCSILFVKKPVFNLLGITEGTSLWIKIPVVIMVYQVLLVAVGFLLGQGRFFWEKEKKLFRLLARPFRRTPPPAA